VARLTEVGAAIQPLDPEAIKKNPYIAYNCIRRSKNGVVVSNGSHTDPIYALLEQGVSPKVALAQVLEEMGYEKDDYNTPRIAGIVTEAAGFLGIVRADGLEVSEFALEVGLCRIICTYEMDRITEKRYAFSAKNAEAAARFVVEDGIFEELELPICSAAWLEELAVYNPHELVKPE
jgi:IMP cyclohydrolase